MKKYLLLLLLAFSLSGNAQYNLFVRQNFEHKAGVAYDADAQAFITAAGLTNPIHKSAINQLVLDLKSYGLWTKMKAVYPLVGGTAFTHKWNLKDPRDLNEAFRLVFAGTLTHNANGITGSTDGYAVTYVNANTHLVAANNHISNYCSTDTNGSIVDMGSANLALFQRFSNTARSYNTTADIINVANTTSLGFYVSTRTSTTSHKLYKNASVLGSSTALTTASLTSSVIGLLNPQDFGSYYSNRRYGWFSIGEGLNDTEEANLYTAVQAYQTILGRQI